MIEQFKRELKRSIGCAVDHIEFIEKNLLVISDSQAAVRIERSVARLKLVEYAYYNPKKGGIVFKLTD